MDAENRADVQKVSDAVRSDWALAQVFTIGLFGFLAGVLVASVITGSAPNDCQVAAGSWQAAIALVAIGLLITFYRTMSADHRRAVGRIESLRSSVPPPCEGPPGCPGLSGQPGDPAEQGSILPMIVEEAARKGGDPNAS